MYVCMHVYMYACKQVYARVCVVCSFCQDHRRFVRFENPSPFFFREKRDISVSRWDLMFVELRMCQLIPRSTECEAMQYVELMLSSPVSGYSDDVRRSNLMNHG